MNIKEVFKSGIEALISLAIIVAVPIALNIFTIYLTGKNFFALLEGSTTLGWIILPSYAFILFTIAYTLPALRVLKIGLFIEGLGYLFIECCMCGRFLLGDSFKCITFSPTHYPSTYNTACFLFESLS